ncbi:hypothetical protein HWV62_19769 [Athelia sp. TMB]|nr:hypothetical protein HWV62_19769 [Athelia sp. TMB]
MGKWRDEIPGADPSSSQSQPSSPSKTYPSTIPVTPMHRQRAEQLRSQSQMTPVPPSKKRPRSPSSEPQPQLNPTPKSEASRRRLANIQAALGAPSTSQTPLPALNMSIKTGITPAKKQRLANIQAAIGSMPRPKPDAEDDEEARFFSAFSSPPPVATHEGPLPKMMTPAQEQRRLANVSKQEDDEYDCFFSPTSIPLPEPPTPTPPRRIKLDYGGMVTPPMSTSPGPSPSTSKGKATQWEKIQADTSSPFHALSASLRTTEPASSVPTTSATGPLELPQEIQALIDGAHALPAYIAKLQRRQTAAERSAEAKGHKIKELQADNERLRNKSKLFQNMDDLQPITTDQLKIATIDPFLVSADTIEQVVALLNRVYVTAEAGMWKDGWVRTDSQEIAKLIAKEEIVAAYQGSTLIGVIRLHQVADDVLEFGMLAVAPEQRSTGAGRALLKYVESTAKEQGIPKMQLEILVPKT